MKRILSLLMLVFVCINTIIPIAYAAEDKNKASKAGVTINVYNWGEYISDGTEGTLDVNKEFTRRTGINVEYNTFQSNEEMFAKLSSGGANYDVIIPSDYMIGKLIEKNMLKKLSFSNIPNFNKIDKSFKNPQYDPTNEYSVPYTWGVFGIFYNKKLVSEREEDINWNILWNEKYKDKILMFDNSRDSFGIAQIKEGKSVNSADAQVWYDAADELIRQKPLVQAYVMDQIFDKMANGEAALAPYYAGDAALLMKSNPDIGFVIPKEGTNKFVDAMCIPIGAEHPEEAEKYINFMCETDIGLANIEYIGYSTPQTEVKTLLPESISNNPIYYPSEETLSNAQVFANLPDDISVLLDDLWVQVKAGGSGSTIGLIVVLLGFICSYFGVVIYKRVKIRKSM